MSIHDHGPMWYLYRAILPAYYYGGICLTYRRRTSRPCTASLFVAVTSQLSTRMVSLLFRVQCVTNPGWMIAYVAYYTTSLLASFSYRTVPYKYKAASLNFSLTTFSYY